MDSREAIKQGIDMGNMIAMSYVEDLDDDQLMHRPHPESNHIKWQLGHLISSGNQMIDGVVPGAMPALPDGFGDKYTNDTAKSNDASAFDSKDELLRLYQQQFDATLAALEKQSDEDLDKPSPEPMREYAPTAGAVFNLIGGHILMHAGQWAVIRRQLGKPPLF